MKNIAKDEAKKNFSLKQLFKIQVINNQRRIVISVISGLLVFLVISSFFLVWYSYRSNAFTTYLEIEHDWQQDKQISVYYSTITASFIPQFSSKYIDNLIIELKTSINSVIPGIITSNTTASMVFELFYDDPSEGSLQKYEIISFDENTTNVVINNLVAGHMPESSNEIVYYRESVTDRTYQVNDTISLKAISSPSAYEQNFTIVGIVENLKGVFNANDRSTDILDWQNYLENYRYVFQGKERFLTSMNFFIDLMNSYPEHNGGRAVLIDFVYQNDKIDVRNISEIIDELQLLIKETTYLETEPNESFSVFHDLFSSLISFQIHWLQETFRMIAMTIPLVFLIGLTCVEIISLGTTEYKLNFKIMKQYGLENRTIRKIILFEGLLFAGSSLILGFFFGYFVGLLITALSFGLSISYYSSSLSEPLLLITLVIVFIGAFLGSIITKNRLLRKTLVTRSDYQKEKKHSTFKEIAVNKEVFLFLLGAIILTIGIILMTIFPEASNFEDNNSLYGTIKAIAAWSMIYSGAVILAISLFFIAAKTITTLWFYIGKILWKSRKNFLTLSLKNLSADAKQFRRITFVVLMIGIGIIPGFVMKTSISNHLNLEANLETGCANMLIPHWNTNIDTNEIKSIAGVESVTEVTQVYIEFRDDSIPLKEMTYSITLLALHNPEEFIQISDLNKLGKISFTTSNILALRKNLTCMLSEDYAKKERINQASSFINTKLGPSSQQLTLDYIHSFGKFPLLPCPKNIPFQTSYVAFSLVTSLATEQMIEKALINPNIAKDYSLLIKTNPNANLDLIQETIETSYGITSLTQQQIIASLQSKNNNNFAVNTMITNTILTILITFFFGFITAKKIYNKRVRIIEASYHSGAKRSQLWQSFTLEMSLVSLFPMIMSVIVGIVLLPLIGNLFLINQQCYTKFAPWVQWWVVLLIFLFGLGITISGWICGIVPSIIQYQPIKQE